MTMNPELVLRDIHQTPAPPWWPPAPGWWLLAAIVLLLVALAAWWAWRRRRRQQAIAALFDDTLARAPSPAAQVAQMSQLLRRAARRNNPDADRLRGEDWLLWLDGESSSAHFSQGCGRLLLDGGFRRDLDDAAVQELQPLARERYLALMIGAR